MGALSNCSLNTNLEKRGRHLINDGGKDIIVCYKAYYRLGLNHLPKKQACKKVLCSVMNDLKAIAFMNIFFQNVFLLYT